jgi:hypothetical protein
MSKTTPSTADGASVHTRSAVRHHNGNTPIAHNWSACMVCGRSVWNNMAGTPKALNNPDRHEHTARVTCGLTRSLCQAKLTHVWVRVLLPSVVSSLKPHNGRPQTLQTAARRSIHTLAHTFKHAFLATKRQRVPAAFTACFYRPNTQDTQRSTQCQDWKGRTSTKSPPSRSQLERMHCNQATC